MREHYQIMIFCDFKVRLHQGKCLQGVQLAYGNEALSYATVFR